MYDEAYKVYQSILAKIPTENTDTPMKKIGGLLGRSITKEEKRPMEPSDRIARYVARIRRDRRELNNG
jgi:hypothetical protein|tara:strand:+ start:371 stop:574 length:204 start_codon:yes stop_codon:yes gene_type:complete